MNEFPDSPENPFEHGPPIPPPSPYSCPKCGLPMAEPVPYCPRCGAKLEPNKPAGVLAIIGAIGLGCLALPSALFGGCFVLFGMAEPGSDQGAMVAYGVLGLAFTALCIWGIIRLLKGRRG